MALTNSLPEHDIEIVVIGLTTRSLYHCKPFVSRIASNIVIERFSADWNRT
jgi:hypothetical protein